MKHFVVGILLGLAGIAVSLIFFGTVGAGEQLVEYPPNHETMCRQTGGCVVIPKRVFENAMKIIDGQSETIRDLRRKLGKSCA